PCGSRVPARPCLDDGDPRQPDQGRGTARSVPEQLAQEEPGTRRERLSGIKGRLGRPDAALLYSRHIALHKCHAREMAYDMAARAGFGDSILISEASRHERRRVLILPGAIAVICALLTTAASFVILTGLTPFVPDES